MISTIAHELVGEIEWVGAFGGDDRELRATFAAMLRDPDFVAVVHETLNALFDYVGEHGSSIVGHQEPELEAAGMVKSALKYALIHIAPEAASMLRSIALTAKFKRIPLPTTQAPRNMMVPSMREQLAGRKPFIPDKGGAA